MPAELESSSAFASVFSEGHDDERAAESQDRRKVALVEAAERRFRALLARCTEPIWLLDAELHIAFASPAAADLMGADAIDLMGRRFDDVGALLEDEAPAVMEALASAVESARGAPVTFAARFRGRSGEARSYVLIARNLLHDAAVRGVVVNGRDVTDLHNAEERLRAAQRLESLGRLGGGIAHDFNNILTVIASCAGFLRQSLERGETAQPSDLDAIEEAIRRGSELTRRLLASARSGPGTLAPADLNATVQRTEQLLRRVLGENVDIVVRLAHDLPPVAFDPAQIEQALLNLATDARDEMPEGGTIVVHTAYREGTPSAPACVLLSVHHSPRGRDDDDDDDADDEARGKPRGTPPYPGLPREDARLRAGLAIVQGIVERMGGSARCLGEHDKGTWVEIELPLGEGASRSSSPPASEDTTAGTETILLVEDDVQLRSFVPRALRKAGYRVLVADSGQSALDLVSKEPGVIHLVLCDVVMPGMSGPEAVERLRARRPDLKTLYVSGYVDDSASARGLTGAGEALLSKPFTPQELLARVRATLDA